MADTAVHSAYRFGPFHLDVRERRLSRAGGEVIPLRLKVFDTLLVLVENAGRLVTKQTLLDRVWPETTVEENNLNHNVSVLRKALGEKATGQQYIETVPRVGYRFAAPVDAAVGETGAAALSAAKPRQDIRYCTTSDGVRLAYATAGNGPPPSVFMSKRTTCSGARPSSSASCSSDGSAGYGSTASGSRSRSVGRESASVTR